MCLYSLNRLADYMAYTRGSSEEWDRYARLSGDSGWSWAGIQRYLRKVIGHSFTSSADIYLFFAPQNEKWTPPADHHNTAGQFNPLVHSSTGINSVSLPGFSHGQFDSRIIATTQENPSHFPFNLDMNSGRPLGVGKLLNIAVFLVYGMFLEAGCNRPSTVGGEAVQLHPIWAPASYRDQICMCSSTRV